MRYLPILFLALCTLAPAQQSQSAQDSSASAGQESAKPDCKGMMAKMQQHRSAMKQMDAELRANLAKMEDANGEAKVEAMADVVTMLVQQRLQMHERMTSLDNDRMQHMMGHMQQGDKGMMNCPMMQEKMQRKSPEN